MLTLEVKSSTAVLVAVVVFWDPHARHRDEISCTLGMFGNSPFVSPDIDQEDSS